MLREPRSLGSAHCAPSRPRLSSPVECLQLLRCRPVQFEAPPSGEECAGRLPGSRNSSHAVVSSTSSSTQRSTTHLVECCAVHPKWVLRFARERGRNGPGSIACSDAAQQKLLAAPQKFLPQSNSSESLQTNKARSRVAVAVRAAPARPLRPGEGV